MKKILICLSLLLVVGCNRDAQIASHNLSRAADQFEILRRVVFYNGITGKYILSIEGFCSLNPSGTKLTVTCKHGPSEYKKHYLGLSDNVTYFAEQINSKNVSVSHYKVIFKPLSIIPDIDVVK